jgi:hypothetical protein
VRVLVLKGIVEWHALVIFNDLHTLNHPALSEHPQIADGLERNLPSQLLQSFIVITAT